MGAVSALPLWPSDPAAPGCRRAVDSCDQEAGETQAMQRRQDAHYMSPQAEDSHSFCEEPLNPRSSVLERKASRSSFELFPKLTYLT